MHPTPPADSRNKHVNLAAPTRLTGQRHKEHSREAAMRLCQAWIDGNDLADEFVLGGHIDYAKRLCDDGDDK